MSKQSVRQRRESELARQREKGWQQLTSPFTAKVVGVSFTRHYPSNLRRLAQLWAEHSHHEESLPIILRRRPNNPHDSNAVEVHVPALGDWGFIGHITSPIASRLAPEIDSGVRWRGHVADVLIHPDHEDRPGISIKLSRLNQGEMNG